MDQSSTYYDKANEWKQRVHILPENDAWRRDWPDRFRDDLVITPAGLFVVRREDDYTYARPATQQDAAAYFAPWHTGQSRQGGIVLPARVPLSLLKSAVKFFLTVWRGQRREDVLLLYLRDQDKCFRLDHPRLRSASASHVDYEVPVTPLGWTHFGSVHSHGGETAYQSSTDQRDDLASPGLHIIVGSFDHGWPTLHCIFSHGGYCFSVPAGDVFTDDTVDEVSFPDDWLEWAVPIGPRSVQTPQQPISYPSGGYQHVQGTARHVVPGRPIQQPGVINRDWLGWD